MPSDWSVSVGKQAKGKLQKETFKRKTFRTGVRSESHGGCGYTRIGRAASAYLVLVPAVHNSFSPSSPSLCCHHCLYSCMVNKVGDLDPVKMSHQKGIRSPSDLLQSPTTDFAGIAEVMMWERDCAAEERRSCWRKPNQPHRGVTFWGSESCVWLPLHHTALSLVVCLCYWKNVV